MSAAGNGERETQESKNPVGFLGRCSRHKLPTGRPSVYEVAAQKVSSSKVSYPAPKDGKSAISRPPVFQICRHVAATDGRLRGMSSIGTTFGDFVVPTTMILFPR